jgi:hypothetical protein
MADKKKRADKLLDELMLADTPTLKEAIHTAVRALMDEGDTADEIRELVEVAVDAAIDRQAREDEDAHTLSPHFDYAGYHAMLKATGRKCSVCEAENKLTDGSKPN